MGSHPLNLVIRFILELWALIAMSYWGWMRGENWMRIFPAVGIPMIAATLWGVFAVPDDPSRSGKAPIAVPGNLRLLLELAVFSLAVWALNDLRLEGLSWALGVSCIVHYIASYDRVWWLIGQKAKMRLKK